jgi:hypothetical protein
MSSRKWFASTAFVTLALAMVALSGCIRVEVVDRSPSVTTASPAAQEETALEHDLAVLAVDFDPPLEYDEVVALKARGEGITLLVAVENTGTSAEQSVMVKVTLSGNDSKAPFLQKEGVIESIAPGEIKIVQFRDTEIPFSYTYQLGVQVVPVAGESRVTDNQKRYDLLISQP